MKNTIKLVFICLLGLFPITIALASNDTDSQFFPALLLGNGYDFAKIEQVINNNQLEVGVYSVDVFVNDTFVQREDIHFYNNQTDTLPCLSASWFKSLGVHTQYIHPIEVKDQTCLNPVQVDDTHISFDSSALRLSLSVPQAYFYNKPRGYIDPQQWQAGTSALFVNYNTNYYHTEFDGNPSSESLFLNLYSGINIGMWRFRNQSTYTYNEFNNDSNTSLQSVRTYVSRAIPDLMADFSLGELNTQSRKLSNLSFVGMQLQSDTRMYPDSQQGYAPVIRGIAKTAALVVVKQKDQKIYQTSVAPGPFEISDLYPTAYRGDLQVEVIEVNGQVSTFTVPYASRPGALRLGQHEFSLSIGESQDYAADDWLVDGSYKVGLSNLITANADLRVSDDYYALGVGSILNTSFGAFGAEMVYSLTNRSYGHTWLDGWKFGVDYSRTFDTGTTLTVAGYHYSTDGYRELTDVLNRNDFAGSQYYSSSYKQREEMTLSVNQNLGRMGMISLNGTKRTYRDGKEDDDQYGLGYSTTFGSVSLNINYSRQYTTVDMNTRQSEDLWTASISIPLFSAQHMLTSSYNYSENYGDSVDVGMSGTLGEDKTLSYNVSASRQMPNTGIDSNRYYLGVNKRTSVGTFGANYTKGHDYLQYGANATGSIVLHSGGINLAQSLGETFAIVHAEGAEGADVLNTYGQKVGFNDYALVPNLIAYRENDVMLGGEYSPYVEIMSSGHKVVPMAGAAVAIEVQTRKGYPLLIDVSQGQNIKKLPIGATVSDQDNQEVGIVGQNGVIYARVATQQGKLNVQWGKEQCVVHYQVPHLKNKASAPRFFRLDSVCK